MNERHSQRHPGPTRRRPTGPDQRRQPAPTGIHGAAPIAPPGVFGKEGSAIHSRMERLLRHLDSMMRDYPRRELADAVRHLSDSLTRHRGASVKHGYLDSEIVHAAYCAHFLPWNIYRLALAWRQSRPLGFSLKDKVIEDWGAGPMTALLALWVSGALEAGSVTYRAIDKSPEMLEWGMQIAKRLGLHRLCTIATSAHTLEFEDEGEGDAGVDLLVVVEAFNEWLPQRGRDTRGIDRFARTACRVIKPDGELFVLEPASRVVSWGVKQLRESLLRMGTQVLAPCTHARPCPLLDPRLKAWCHFRHPVSLHPAHASLARLSDGERTSLSYSYIHARMVQHAPLAAPLAVKVDVPEGKPQAFEKPKPSVARVFSDPIRVMSGYAVYACGPHGRIQIESPTGYWPRESGLEQGTLVNYHAKKKPLRDNHSRAARVMLRDCKVRK